MPTWLFLLEVEFRDPVPFRPLISRSRPLRFLTKMFGRAEPAAGFYQNYGITSETLDHAKQIIIERVYERYPQWKDNVSIAFDKIEEWSVSYARTRLATDLEKLATGDPVNHGIWMEQGCLFYPPEDNP